ncbi:MAG: sigma-70 family RNA polymerase sigma factor [Sciscionella sp.]
MNDDEITRAALAAQQGDRDAAAAFIRATSPQLRRVLRYLGDSGHIDDLAQETYLRAFAALPRFANRSPARLWLLSIARRVAADGVRKAQRSPKSTGSPESYYDAQLRGRSPDHSGLVALRQAIATLAPERREAFVLTRVIGLSYAEAADACGCPVGTIRSRIYRARTDLMAALREGEGPLSATGD